MIENSTALIQDFEQYFKIEFVKSELQRKQVYSIRYRVYCEEFNYEAKDVFPDKLERDEFDDQSIHCLVIHKSTQAAAACVRLVPVCEEKENGLLPFEKFCLQSLDTELIDNLNLVRNTECEISRLAVDGAFRRRPGESATRYGGIESMDFTKHEQRTFSLIAIAAFLAGTALTELSNKTNVFAMMEPFLPRLLRRSGIMFDRAGSDIDYHGIRALYFSQTQIALDNMRPDLKLMYDWVYNQIKDDFDC